MAFFETRRQRAGLLVALLGIAIALALVPFVTGLLGIVVLYVICAPAHRRLSRVIPPRLSAFLVLTVALVLVLLPLGVMVGVIVAEAPEAIAVLRANADRFSTLRVGGIDVGPQLAAAGGTAAAWVSEQALGFFGSAARSLLSLVIAFFGLYYLLLYPGVVWKSVRDFVPFSDPNADMLRARFFSVTQATLVGTALTALLQGTMVGVAFWALGLPGPAFWAVITGLVSVLPMLGSALVWIPGMVVLGMDGRWGAMVILGIVGVAAGSTDNIVRMVVFKKVSNIHPLATLVGAFAGLKLFGLLGVLLGPLAIAYFFELLKMYREEYLGAAAPHPVALETAQPAMIVQAPD
ncbi:AI-2E family transporter [Longimicrobium sp.]|uniref:AI-2E family transporter n=1 Tax=Longimicrobium sp. TaxID=2029185 RepID=UPI003B3B5BEB